MVSFWIGAITMPTNAEIITYGNALVRELQGFGACATELRMVTKEMIVSSIMSKVQPKDAAWLIVE